MTHTEKKRLRKKEEKLNELLKDISLTMKIRKLKAVVFSLALNGCERWPLKKNKEKKIDIFKLWLCSSLLKIACDTARTNQAWTK